MSAKKIGRLTKDEEDFIRANMDTMQPSAIAKQIKRSGDAVRAAVARFKIERQVASIIDDEKPLKDCPEWVYLQAEFSEEELEMIEYKYNQYIHQFKEDVASTERSQLIMAIKLEVLMHRSLTKKKKNLDFCKSIEKKIRILTKKSPDLFSMPKEDSFMLMQLEKDLISFHNTDKDLNREHNEYMERHSVIMRELKGTREQRVKINENSKISWVDLIKNLMREEVREAEGKYMEIVNRAGKKEQERLGEYHQYADGVLDKPIFNSDTVKEKSDET